MSEGKPTDEFVQIEGTAVFVRRASFEDAVSDLSNAIDVNVPLEDYAASLKVLFSASFLGSQPLSISEVLLHRGQITERK